MKRMYRSSGHALKRMLQDEIKAFQGIQEVCTRELKNVHPADTEVKNRITAEREFTRLVICRLMLQLDANQQDILQGMD